MLVGSETTLILHVVDVSSPMAAQQARMQRVVGSDLVCSVIVRQTCCASISLFVSSWHLRYVGSATLRACVNLNR